MSIGAQWLGEHRLQVSMIDVSRAYFNARTNTNKLVFVQLPFEDPIYGQGICGRLSVHMLGQDQRRTGGTMSIPTQWIRLASREDSRPLVSL